MLRYLLDTNICIYLLRGHPPELIARLEALDYGEVAMSAIVLAELRVGLERQPETRAQNEAVLNDFLQLIPALPFDADAAVQYGLLRAAVPDRNRDALDRLIAAHALSVGAALVTNNESDFKDYPGLKVENWVSAP
jgi:tRNA(fMet)-specific endonuclease VapC